MTARTSLLLYLLTAALLLPLQGCFFTGIESTPKITASEVRRQGAVATAEQLLSARIAPVPFGLWTPGKRFVVTDTRFNRLPQTETTFHCGDTLTLRSVSEKIAVTADTVTVLTLAHTGGTDVELTIESSTARLAAQPSVELPFLVDLDLVACADSVLRSTICYTLTSKWQTDSVDAAVPGKKFTWAIIQGVEAGDAAYPLRVNFTDCETGALFHLPMTAGPERTATRNFDRLFSLSDPRLRYPSISDETWLLIQRGRIVKGMTREEARLSAGAPRDVQKGQNGAVLFERWLYENGRHITFIDNIVENFSY